MRKFITDYALLIAATPFVIVGLMIYLWWNKPPNPVNVAWNATYSACHQTWDANDTMRKSAMVASRAIFIRMNQASLAPDSTWGAINHLCTVEANTAHPR